MSHPERDQKLKNRHTIVLMEGSRKKSKVELISPDSAYHVFRTKDLRDTILPMLPIVSWLCIWQAFPLLYKSVDIRKMIWEQFERQVLPVFGIAHTTWMHPHLHAFTGSRVVEFLLGEQFVDRQAKSFESDLDILICGRSNSQGFVHDAEHMVDTVDVLMIATLFGMINQGGDMLKPKTINGQYSTYSRVNGFKRSKTYMRDEYDSTSYKMNLVGWKVWPPLLDNETRSVDFLKSMAPMTDMCVSQYDLDCCKVSINPKRMKIFSLKALVHKQMTHPIDEHFVQVYPKGISTQFTVKNAEIQRSIDRISTYKKRGFDIRIERVSDTPGGVMAYLSTNLMLPLEQTQLGAEIPLEEELAHRAKNMTTWVRGVPKAIANMGIALEDRLQTAEEYIRAQFE